MVLFVNSQHHNHWLQRVDPVHNEWFELEQHVQHHLETAIQRNSTQQTIHVGTWSMLAHGWLNSDHWFIITRQTRGTDPILV